MVPEAAAHPPVLSGLTQREVEERQARGLVNRVRKETSRTYAGIFWSNVFNVFNIAVFTMAAVLLGLWVYAADERTLYDSIAISAVAIVNTIIGIVQEIRAKIALDRVSALARPTATVIRDGREREIPAEDVVEGELIKLARGDQVPVDGRMVRSHHCEVDESLLTGESATIYKSPGDELLSGSFCVAGHGVLVAEKVGEASYVHRLTREIRHYKRFVTPLQHQIDRIIQILMGTAALLAFLVVAAAFARARIEPPPPGEGVEVVIETTRSVTSVLTSMVPMGLILLSTVAFALGVFRISRRGALIQKLNAVESFANVNVLCMDKTGTLTRNELAVERIAPGDGQDAAVVAELLACFAHGSSDKNATIVAIEQHTAPPAFRVLDEIPFNSREKYSAVSLETGERTAHLWLGAFEALSGRLPDAERERARAVIDDEPGLRHLVFAELPEAQGSLRAAFEAGAPLRLLGVLSLVDEMRPGIEDVLRDFDARGIALKIVSGDAPETVRAVARKAGWTGDTTRVVTGPDIDAMAPEALAAAARTCSLFARVSPENKRSLVGALQEQGKYVAMVGDGVNDVLALKKAQLGVAMGAGNRMSRDVSDIVLLQNDFTILPRVLDEGATIISNVQSAAKLFLTKNLYAVMLILFTGFIGLAFPFVPRHITLIGFFTISVPALLLTFTRRSREIPGPFLKEVLRFTAISGGCIAIASLVSYFVSVIALEAPVERARTVVLTQVIFLSLLNFLLILGGGRLRENLRRNWLLATFAVCFAGLYLFSLLVVTQTDSLKLLARFFEIERLEGIEIALALLMTIVVGAVMTAVQQRVARSGDGKE